MNLPERVNKCPVRPECTAKVLFVDTAGNVYRFDVKTKEFKKHTCLTKGASHLPVIAYGAEWYNKNTGRTRYLGPERMQRSVEKAPTDERFRKRGAEANSAWEHKQTYAVELIWKPIRKLP